MTELLDGAVEARCSAEGRPIALRTAAGWREVTELVLTWRVETDWWRRRVSRDYMRCLLAGGECVDVYRDRDDGTWHWVRRYD